MLTFRSGLEFNCTDPSQFGFEFFMFRSPPCVQEMDCFLAKTKELNCKRLLDVGAFHGVFSLAFCAGANTRQAVAIEPSPKAHTDLHENAALNNFNISIHHLALSDQSGEIEMSYEWDHAVATRGVMTPAGESITVNRVLGDEFCRHNQFDPDVIKIDVEGHELKVLAGLKETIEQCRPIIFVELHPDRLQRESKSFEDVAEFAASVGYQVTNFGGAPFIPETQDKCSNSYVFMQPI